ncbi:ISAs1 family transposase [Micromonospora sp. NPDC005299]|uniref:ISAs1 family transposase n=1 Tax=Micromonospora sp. NPDC005299 TaxID=3364231 RepID=UPI00369FDEA5
MAKPFTEPDAPDATSASTCSVLPTTPPAPWTPNGRSPPRPTRPPELRAILTGLDLTGCLVTADAAHCQHATATAIIEAGGAYLLTVKANQAALLEALIPLFTGANDDWDSIGALHTNCDRGHGRTEERHVRLTAAVGVEFPGAAQAFRPIGYRGGLDGPAAANKSSTASPAWTRTRPDPPPSPLTSAATGRSKTRSTMSATPPSPKTTPKSAPARTTQHGDPAQPRDQRVPRTRAGQHGPRPPPPHPRPASSPRSLRTLMENQDQSGQTANSPGPCDSSGGRRDRLAFQRSMQQGPASPPTAVPCRPGRKT